MFSYHILFLAVSLLNVMSDHHATSCDTNCTDKPVFSPSVLVVKHGDSAAATCFTCQTDCDNKTFGLETSKGEITENLPEIFWNISTLTEWGIRLMCYSNHHLSGEQCCTNLPITLYQAPNNVSISVDNHTGPMFEARHYTLTCTVQDVAPVKNLAVTFYRGKTPLGQPLFSSNTQTKPVTQVYTQSIVPSKEDDGAQYWCEAKLQLGPEGPQRPPVVTSQKIHTTVYYKPQLKASPHPENITVTEGDSLLLGCSAVGNPPPSYTWTLPSSSHLDGNVLAIESVGHEHEGTFTCSVSNMLGRVEASFNVQVRANYTPYIVVAVLVAGVLTIACASVIYMNYYKNHRMGKYNMADVFRWRKQLIPTPSA